MIRIRELPRLIKYKLIRLFGPQAILVDGVFIPAQHLRAGGYKLRGNKFLLSARREAQRLKDHFGLSEKTKILEIGCGAGRLPIGIISNNFRINSYRGVDVIKFNIDWCKKYIAKKYPSFNFFRLDLKNARYNPNGKPMTGKFLPFNDTFDIIYLYSVFSHMKTEDIEAYLSEFQRLLSPGGKIFLTAFIENDVPDMTENPSNYREDWQNQPLHCVRYEKNYFESMLKKFGFAIDRLEHGEEDDGLSGVYMSRIG